MSQASVDSLSPFSLLFIMLSDEQALAAQTITDCYQQLSAKKSNLVLELVPEESVIYQWQHYPKNDIKNKTSQFYYHSHERSQNPNDNNDVHEHGHFHCFVRRPGDFTSAEPLIISEKYRNDPTKDNLCHLIAIAINHHAQPTALFTLNHWVVEGLWYPADVVIELLDKFEFTMADKHPLLSCWVSAMIRLFKPQIIELLQHRDHVISQWKGSTNVFRDKSLEVTSLYSFV